MTTDVEIAQQFTPRPINEISEKLGIDSEDLHPYGRDIAKIDLKTLNTKEFPKTIKCQNISFFMFYSFICPPNNISVVRISF